MNSRTLLAAGAYLALAARSMETRVRKPLLARGFPLKARAPQ